MALKKGYFYIERYDEETGARFYYCEKLNRFVVTSRGETHYATSFMAHSALSRLEKENGYSYTVYFREEK